MQRISHYNANKYILRTIVFIIVLIGACTMVVPFLWMISSSLKSISQIFAFPPKFIPNPVEWKNYIFLFEKIRFARYFLNSIFVATTVTTLTVFICALAGFGFAKYNFPFKKTFFFYFLINLMIPIHITIIPIFLVFKYLGLIDTYLALILPGLTSAFGIFLMRQFTETIPDDLIDAARIDGCREIGIFWRIIIPNIKPAIGALAIFIFIGVWNDFMWPLIAINTDSLKPLQVGLASFTSEHSTQWNLMMAGVTCALLPVIIIFLSFQKYFVTGITLTGLKE